MPSHPKIGEAKAGIPTWGGRVREVWDTLPPDLQTRIYWDAEEMDNAAWNDGIEARGEDR